MVKKKNETGESIDVCISFDTTGSMYPCLTQVRRVTSKMVSRLFSDVAGLRVAVIAHGDYCDKNTSYVTKVLDFTNDEDEIVDFINNVGQTHGGDAPECYELVLNKTRSLKWKSGRNKVLVMIGDDVPHGPTYPGNTEHIDWRNELSLLLEMNVNVYAVHAMPGCRGHSKKFYDEIAHKTGGFYLTLDQFSSVPELITACCIKQSGNESLEKYEKELHDKGRMSRHMQDVLDTLLKRKNTKKKPTMKGLVPVPSGRFQVMDIDSNCAIKEFVDSQGITFKKGRGFYQLTKAEDVQGYKEIVLMDKDTCDIFTGDAVRNILGIPPRSGKDDDDRQDVRLHKTDLEKWYVFIQSTSVNRKLIGGTTFLYEVEDWDRGE